MVFEDKASYLEFQEAFCHCCIYLARYALSCDSKEQRKRENTVFCHVVSLKCIADFFNKYCYDALLVEYLVQL